MRNVAVLRQQQNLIDSRLFPLLEVAADFVGRSEAVLRRGGGKTAGRAVIVVDTGPARFVFAEQIMMAEGMEEKPSAVATDPTRLVTVAIAQIKHREGDIGVDAEAHRFAFSLDNPVVLLGVLAGFLGRDKAEGQRADSQFRR